MNMIMLWHSLNMIMFQDNLTAFQLEHKYKWSFMIFLLEKKKKKKKKKKKSYKTEKFAT